MTNAIKICRPDNPADQVSTAAVPVYMPTTDAGQENRTTIDLDDLISDLCAEDPRLEAAIEAGRQWIGSTLLADKPDSLRALRLAAGMSQKQLANAIHSSQSYIAKLEAGTVEPGVHQVVRLAEALNQPRGKVFEALVGGSGEKQHG